MLGEENTFYEHIESTIRSLLPFVPRYIGVLNVTQHIATDEAQGGGSKKAHHFRFAKSCRKSDAFIPEVKIEQNSHMLLPPSAMTPPSPPNASAQHPLWKGHTTINYKLQEQVLREVFAPRLKHKNQTRPVIVRPSTASLSSTPTNSKTVLSTNAAGTDKQASLERLKDKVEKVKKHENYNSENYGESPPATKNNLRNSLASRLSDVHIEINSRADMLQSRSLLRASHPEDSNIPRRHSSGNLVKSKNCLELMPIKDVAFAAADGGGGEEDGTPLQKRGKEFEVERHRGESTDTQIFEMDPWDEESNVNTKTTDKVKFSNPDTDTPDRRYSSSDISRPKSLRRAPSYSSNIVVSPPSTPTMSIASQLTSPQPSETQTYILIEDLTRHMKRPCVLDLKMGTRQYGVDATPQKRVSMMRKCSTTTSRQLGVRMCGMQVWNPRSKSYLYQDKYYGRDVKAGAQFQSVLTRYLTSSEDDIHYDYIPGILEKLKKLENIVENLKGYRLYASSLLLLYDGADEKELNGWHPRANDEVTIKLVDFAHAVIPEWARDASLPPLKMRCPPKHPNAPDRGYLRGLKSLQLYFSRIYYGHDWPGSQLTTSSTSSSSRMAASGHMGKRPLVNKRAAAVEALRQQKEEGKMLDVDEEEGEISV